MIHVATIREIAEGVKVVHAGELLTAELHFSLAQQALLKLQRLIDADAATQKPVRLLAIVGPRDEDADTLPSWMNKKRGGDDGNAA